MAKPQQNKHRNPAPAASGKKSFTKLDALSVREYEEDGETKTAFSRIGVCLMYEDGNGKLMLDALPVNGTILIRHPLPPRE